MCLPQAWTLTRMMGDVYKNRPPLGYSTSFREALETANSHLILRYDGTGGPDGDGGGGGGGKGGDGR